MSYIRISNNDGTYSLVHSDDEGTYLAHHGVKNQRWGVRRFQNYDGSLTEKGKRRMKTLQGKSDKLDAKKAKLNSQKSKLNPLKEIDAEYARSLAEKVDKRKDKK